MTVLADAVTCLQNAGIRFALVGAAAMAAHGVSRSTADVDMITTDTRVLQPAFWPVEARVDVRRGDADDPLAGVVRLTALDEPVVDVIVGRHAWQRRLVEQAKPITFEGVTVPVVDRSGLILLKLFAGGAQDAWDIRQLLDAADAGTDAEVERVLPELPSDATELWRRLRAERA